MHNDPIIRLWMLQNALTTFTQIVHCADRLFFYKNNCQGVIFLAHFFWRIVFMKIKINYFQLATTVSPQTNL